MKKRSLAALIGLVAIGTACSSDGQAVSLAETTTTAAPTTSAYVEATTTTLRELQPIDQGNHTFSPEDTYVARVIDETELDSYYYDNEILAFGWMVCEYFSNGGDSQGLVEIIYNAGVKNNASDEVMLAFASAAGIAVAEMCPEHLYLLP